MPLDIRQLINDNEGRNYALHDAHVNPRFARVLRTIGFDRCYVRAEGAYLWDDDGHRYLDMLAGYGAFNVGRNHPHVREALMEFLRMEYPSLVQMEAPLLSGMLAEALKRKVHNQLDIVYFTSTGAEGVETAIKFARCATRRPTIAYASKAFHGLTNGALSLNGDPIFRDHFGPLLPDCQAVPFNDLNALEQMLETSEVAAFVVEPIQGKGVNIPSADYLPEAARLCGKHGALFVVDEVQCGMGRTGRFFAHEHDGNVNPDIVILSKALSGGYVPVGAVLTRKWIYDRVYSSLDRAVVHSSTFGQGSLAMAAGLATLQVMEDQDLLRKAEQTGNRIGQALSLMKERYAFIHDVRWRGLMMGVEFGPPHSLGLHTAWKITHKLNQDLFAQAVIIPLLSDHRVLTQVAGHHMDVIKLLPPLVLSEPDTDWFLAAFERVMEDLHRVPGPIWEVLTRIGTNVMTKP